MSLAPIPTDHFIKYRKWRLPITKKVVVFTGDPAGENTNYGPSYRLTWQEHPDEEVLFLKSHMQSIGIRPNHVITALYAERPPVLMYYNHNTGRHLYIKQTLEELHFRYKKDFGPFNVLAARNLANNFPQSGPFYNFLNGMKNGSI